ncbi:hypothetical protein OSB04_016076, partial [Centaurea solstitialis]
MRLLPIRVSQKFHCSRMQNNNIRAFISSKKCAPIMLRLAWHDAGTYGATTKTGGPNGSIRNEEEFSHGSNNGLKIAIDFC